MSYSFITPKNIHDLFTDAKEYMRQPFQPLAEFERLARNKPHPGIAKGYPKNTDGTLASVVKETPKRVIQQTPIGSVKSNDSRQWAPLIVQHVWENEIIPNANSQGTVLQKAWALFSKAMIYGAQPSFTFMCSNGEYVGADFKVPYIKDIFFQPGQLTYKDCDYFFIRSWYSESNIEAIIDREKKLGKKSKKDGESYETGWDVAVLKEALQHHTKKTTEQMSSGETDRNLDTGGIEVIHAFQKGVGAKFYSFLPSVEKVCRTKVNPDPRGEMPIQFMYFELDLQNPLGRGAIELSGGMQNVLDSMIQASQYTTGLMLNPPLKTRGQVQTSTIKYKPGAIWKMGVGDQNDVEAVNINTTALTNFSSTYGLLKSQILNLNNSQDTSIGADVGNPGFSKTPKGVEAMTQRLGVSDNFLLQQFEAWYSDVAESCINIHMNEKSGVEELELDEDLADKIREIDPELVDENNVFMLDYDQFKDVVFKFEVDASTSRIKEDDSQRELTLELLQLAATNPLVAQYVQVPELIRNLVAPLENSDKIVKSEDEMLAQEQQMDENGMPIDPSQDPMASMQGAGEQLPPEMMQEQAQDPEALQGMPEAQEPMQESEEYGQPQNPADDDMIVQLVDDLRQSNVPDEQIASVIKMVEDGIPVETALETLATAMERSRA